MRALLVEDETQQAALLRHRLAEHAFSVDIAADGVEAMHLAASESYDIILVDDTLPDVDGYRVVAGIRREKQTPIFVLAESAAPDDRIRGLELGADDILAKPVAFPELLARIRGVLRRAPARSDLVVTVGDLRVDLLRRKVERGTRRIDLSRREFALLAHLAQHAGIVLSRAEIGAHVWDMNFDSDGNVVDVLVYRVRAKLEAAGAPRLLHAVRGVGYVLEARDA